MSITTEQITSAITFAECEGRKDAAKFPDMSRAEVGAAKYQILVGYIAALAGLESAELDALLGRPAVAS